MASGKDASLTSSAGLHLAESYEGTATRGAEPGLPIDYCVFCYHGTAILRPDNTSLLSKFVSERGAILPKRFTKCCPKHQRALTSVIKRARSLYLIPIHAKLHPQARFTSFSPPKPALKQASAVNMAHGPGKGFSAILLEELAKP
jgi:small subunit ribosomal protein S18